MEKRVNLNRVQQGIAAEKHGSSDVAKHAAAKHADNDDDSDKDDDKDDDSDDSDDQAPKTNMFDRRFPLQHINNPVSEAQLHAKQVITAALVDADKTETAVAKIEKS